MLHYKISTKTKKVSTKTMDYKRNPKCNWKEKVHQGTLNVLIVIKIVYIKNIKHTETAYQPY